MVMPNLDAIARAIVADGRGILAADETPRTIGKRFAALGVESTPDSRRAFREILFSTAGIAHFIGGVILQDETLRQLSSRGQPLVELLSERGIVPGIKVDLSTHPLALAPDELITEGLDGLRERLAEYRSLGARFCKWRAAILIGDNRPTLRCVHANAQALGRYAALCQEQGLLPIVEPEVLMEGDHTLERCEQVTGYVIERVFDQLYEAHVELEGILLKPNMVIEGHDCSRRADIHDVAVATLRTLKRHVPPAVPAVVFLSGGQSPTLATEHLNAMNQLDETMPWKVTFSYARALQDDAMSAWRGRNDNVRAAQRAFYHRARCNSAAALGQYRPDMESEAELHQTAA
jgi:fructose-bisphosphate aldolase class I